MRRARFFAAGAAGLAAVALDVLALGCGGSASSGPTIKVALTSEGCEPAAITTPAGQTTFSVTNKGAGGVTEFEVLEGNHVLGEVENVVSGLTRSFSVDLKPGTYTLLCPGGSKNANGTLTVTGTAGDATAPDGPVTTIDVAEKDFSISLSGSSGPAGTYSFNITNAGPTTHEFVIVRTDLAADALPLKGSQADEDDQRLKHIDEVESLEANSSTSFAVNLSPGRYAFICNIEGHYQLGMHAAFSVN